jgi:Leucine Rich Repeat
MKSITTLFLLGFWLGGFYYSTPSMAAVPATAKQALFGLYISTVPSVWDDDTNWGTGDPCDDNWYGVDCLKVNKIDHVIGLSLGNNNLTGNIPSGLKNLLWLLELDLSNNNFTGSSHNCSRKE